MPWVYRGKTIHYSAKIIKENVKIPIISVYKMVYPPKSYNKKIKTISQKIGMNNLSPHKIRHSHATIAMANNNPMAMVSKYLSHSNIAITAKTYEHNTFYPDDFENGLIIGMHDTNN